jgi:hypothetical protein
MSADDTDSLLRAVAATPHLSPPAQLASAVAVALGAGDLPQVRALAQPFGGDAVEHTGNAICVKLSGADCARRAASLALALRDAFPRARAAIVTGTVEAAAMDRATALSKDAKGLRIDEQTAALLDATFETRADESAITLLGVRATPSAGASSVSTGDAQIARAIAEERGLSARRYAVIAFVAILLSLAGHLVFPAVFHRTRAAVPVVYLVWLAFSSIRLVAVRTRGPNAGRWMHAIYLVDVPMFFTISVLGSDASGVWYLAWCISVAATLQLFIEARPILVTAALLIATSAALFVHAGTAYLAFFAAVLISFAVAAGIYSQARTRTLLRRVIAESAERVRQAETANREVRALNDELRRQIADRAGQLAGAIARLSGAAPRSLLAGSLVEDRYRVLERIGAGGMGAVYRVERLSDGRPLALKVLTGVADRTALARFAREAQMAAAIDHPNVVSVLDVDVSRSGMLFLVMELVAGGSLAGRRSSYGDLAWALPLLRQIAAALAAMHARGIVHRDLKPSNILLDGATAKVADFGLASLARQAVSGEAATIADDAALANSPELTRTGAMMGTPMYMAPELARGGREALPSADIFSLGVVAYELLSKELPFAASPALERLKSGVSLAAKPVAQARPDLPGELCTLVDGCLAEAPDARPSADAIAAGLDRIISAHAGACA